MLGWERRETEKLGSLAVFQAFGRQGQGVLGRFGILGPRLYFPIWNIRSIPGHGQGPQFPSSWSTLKSLDNLKSRSSLYTMRDTIFVFLGLCCLAASQPSECLADPTPICRRATPIRGCSSVIFGPKLDQSAIRFGLLEGPGDIRYSVRFPPIALPCACVSGTKWTINHLTWGLTPIPIRPLS